MNRTKKVSRLYAEMYDRPDHRRRLGLREDRKRERRRKATKGRMPVAVAGTNEMVRQAQLKQNAKKELAKMPRIKRLLTRKGRSLRHQSR